jgi:hypothetical protein
VALNAISARARIPPGGEDGTAPQHDAAGPCPVQKRADDIAMRDVGHRRRQIRRHVPRAGHRPAGLFPVGALQFGSVHPGPGITQVDAALDDHRASSSG